MAFNLADILKDVSDSGTSREQIQYIPLEELAEDPNNFYQLSDIPALADNISLCGLQQPIRVRPYENGHYQIVSGHRRRAALEMLVADGYEQWKEVPCIVEQKTVSPALQQLQLIFANANTRKMSSAELSEQAEQVEKLLYQLKSEGYDFPGRMRDHVAEAVGASKTKLARLKVIRENLASVWVDDYRSGTIGESVAHALAQMPESWQDIVHRVWGERVRNLYADTVTRAKDKIQKVETIQCHYGLNLCEHSIIMMEKNCREMYCTPCTGCCFECDNLRTCKNCCPQALPKQKELKQVEKQATQTAKAEQAERDRPGSEFAKLVFARVGKARAANGISVETLQKARSVFYSSAIDDAKQKTMEEGAGQYTPNTYLPFGVGMRACDLMHVVTVADALGCSVDYLLGRTDRMEVVPNWGTTDAQPVAVSNSGTTWRTTDPEEPGTYLLMLQDGDCEPTYEKWKWDGDQWFDWSGPLDPYLDGEPKGWMPMPKMPKEET